jgi:hypothetical protein
MYGGFKQVAPEMDIRFELREESETARRLHGHSSRYMRVCLAPH